MKTPKLLLCSAIAVLMTLALAAGTPATSSTRSSGVSCPKKALNLEANSISPAATVALAKEKKSTKPQVVSVALASVDQDRGPMAKSQCGGTAWKKTVVVYIHLRKYHSASLSSRVDFVSRFQNGYRVWEIVH